MTTLAEEYITALVRHLNSHALSDPPWEIHKGFIQDGRYQASPEAYTYVATVHEGDPKDASRSGNKDWRHEVDDKAVMEMPGCASQWLYRYTCHIQYFMTRTGEDQDEALRKMRRLTQWFREKINLGTVTELALTTSEFGEFAYFQQVRSIEVSEGGGPSASYIGRSVLFIEQRVHIPGG